MNMATPILVTRLHIPSPRPEAIARALEPGLL